MAIVATSFDMTLIAVDQVFRNRCQAFVVNICIQQISELSSYKNFCASVLNNLNNYMNTVVWAAAINQQLANDVVTTNGANFTVGESATTVQNSITTSTPSATGATDSDINTAVTNALVAMANTI